MGQYLYFKRIKEEYSRSVYLTILTLVCTLLFALLVKPPEVMANDQIRFGVLMANDTRLDPVEGFKTGIKTFSKHDRFEYRYTIKNAKNKKENLLALARAIISEKPDIAIAAGGIEADALKEAAKNTTIPIVFLSVSSSIDRGLASSMRNPDKNITGIETNDTKLTAKRLWFIKRMLPEARTVMCYHMPSIVPSVESIKVAEKKAALLGLKLIVEEVETIDDIKRVTNRLSKDKVDIILINAVAPIHGALRKIIFPKAMAEKIPVFGYGMVSMKKGAFASYGGSRHANGKQAARLAHKIIHGAMSKDLPIEIPEHYEFIINTWLVKNLALKLPDNTWKMADKIIGPQF